jgi:pyrimidine operon attenuation protein/uracil phosphoribosyltransferase
VNCAQDAAESALSVITTLLDGASRLVDGRFARVMAVRRPLNPSGEAGKEVRMARPHQGSEDREVLDADDVQRALTRIAHEVLERNKGADSLVLLGIPTRGVPLAQRLAQRISEVEGAKVPTGALDITMFRDDLRLRPARGLARTDLPSGGIDDTVVVLVDDVLFSGRSIRAALDALSEVGRPRAVQLAVLVDRGHRQFPIRADYVGKNLPTSTQETVRVLLNETDGQDAVVIGDSGSSVESAGASR